MAEIVLSGVRKSFGRQEVISGIDLEIADGELCVLLGPSGCGKSTLLRLIAGLEEVSAGRILIGGRDVTDRPPKERGLAMVFQSYALYPHMTVFQNLAFGLRLARRRKDEVERRVRETARALRIEELLSRKPGELSGGQRQRVAIGRAMVREPGVLLLDEPLSNLDADLRARMRLELSRLHRRLSATMVYVTHDQVEALTLADRLVLLQQGRIAQSGPPLALYHEPKNLFVARFLGSPPMNLLTGRLVERSAGGSLVELDDGTRLEVFADTVLAGDGEEVILGIRPERLMLGRRGGGLATRVVQVERLGDHNLVYLEGVGGEEPLVARCPPGDADAVGSTRHVALPPEDCHLFDGNGRAFRRVRASATKVRAD